MLLMCVLPYHPEQLVATLPFLLLTLFRFHVAVVSLTSYVYYLMLGHFLVVLFDTLYILVKINPNYSQMYIILTM